MCSLIFLWLMLSSHCLSLPSCKNLVTIHPLASQHVSSCVNTYSVTNICLSKYDHHYTRHVFPEISIWYRYKTSAHEPIVMCCCPGTYAGSRILWYFHNSNYEMRSTVYHKYKLFPNSAPSKPRAYVNILQRRLGLVFIFAPISWKYTKYLVAASKY